MTRKTDLTGWGLLLIVGMVVVLFVIFIIIPTALSFMGVDSQDGNGNRDSDGDGIDDDNDNDNSDGFKDGTIKDDLSVISDGGATTWAAAALLGGIGGGSLLKAFGRRR